MKQTLLKFILTGVIIFLSHSNSFAQQTQTYDSTYQISPGVTGNARFEYYLDKEGNRVKHGNFTFTRQEKQDSSSAKAFSTLRKGDFVHNVKQGEWIYQTKTHNIEIVDISDEGPDYSVHTVDENLNITYEEGIPVNEILLEANLYKNETFQKRLKYFKSSIVQGKLHGDFEFFAADKEMDIVAVDGQVENGLMQGVWNFNYFKDSTQEERTYDQGILLELVKKNENAVVDEIEFPLSEGLKALLQNEESEVELAGKPLSLNFSDGYPRTSLYIKEQEKGKNVLTMILQEIFQYDSNLDITQQLPLGANRGFYPLSSDERNDLSKWTETEAEFRNKLQQLNNLRIDNIQLVQDRELQVFLKWAKEQDRLEEYIRPWKNILSREQIEYYNREGLLVDYAYNLLSTDTVSIDGEKTIFNYSPEEKGNNFLHFIVENFEDRNEVADSLLQAFSNRIESIEIDREISAFSDSISAGKTEIDSLYRIPSGYGLQDKVLDEIKIYFDKQIYPQELEEFNESEDIGARTATATDLLAEIELLKEIFGTAQNIAERREETDELYTELTFDPFTYSDQVPVRKKKRLYNYVTEEVIEGLIERAGSNYQDLTAVLKDLQLAYSIQDRLIFLEDKNTRRLERRLRRSGSLEDSVELLNSL
ncbi:hypothetical protein RM549_09940 [Salegentibacter sp. F188]|uniref:Uncharacterized protein n=1 Tax=Autumnicola patrickiae TaxID=3075591 RepID=A0ABU3E2E7_9FLAO|nr:hypothetical protein [Salegentibacter sp. F188]MDT0690105.1 hypothetical protein [Salegentibacter sp. F188]